MTRFNIPQPKEDVISKALRKPKKTWIEIAKERSAQIIKDLEEMGVFT